MTFSSSSMLSNPHELGDVSVLPHDMLENTFRNHNHGALRRGFVHSERRRALKVGHLQNLARSSALRSFQRETVSFQLARRASLPLRLKRG
jgi:hypothetical protein